MSKVGKSIGKRKGSDSMDKKKCPAVNPKKGSVSKDGQVKGRLWPVIRKWRKYSRCGALLGPGESCKWCD